MIAFYLNQAKPAEQKENIQKQNGCNLATGQDATATNKHKILPLKQHESTANYKKQI